MAIAGWQLPVADWQHSASYTTRRALSAPEAPCVMSLYSNRILQHVPSFSSILLISSLLRVALIIYSEWHDAHSVVKYTDVDYRVFSDAARFVLNPTSENRAEGPLAQFLHIGR